MSRIGFSHLVVVALFGPIPVEPRAQPLTFQQEYSVPQWVPAAVVRAGLGRTHAFDARLNPFCHRGDFDGDGRADFAALVTERVSGKRGIVVVHRTNGAVFVVGAGRKAANGGDDFSWMDAWTVYERGAVSQGASADPPPTLRGDALLVFKTEAASGLLWWDGKAYRWYQQGD